MEEINSGQIFCGVYCRNKHGLNPLWSQGFLIEATIGITTIGGQRVIMHVLSSDEGICWVYNTKESASESMQKWILAQ